MERRAAERVTVNFATRCRVPATPHQATVIDLSRIGCRIRLAETHVIPGTTVHIDLKPAASVSGTVAWVGAQTAGVRFDRRLDSKVAVQMGIEEPAEAAPEDCESIAVAPRGLQHWIRTMFGFSKR